VDEAKPEPLARLRALDQAIARRGASAEARESVRRRLQQSAVEHGFHARLRWWPAVAFAAGAITMGVLLVPEGPAERTPSTALTEAEPSAGPTADAGVAVEPTPTEPSCAALQPGIVRLEVDACVLGDGVRMSALLPSQLAWDGDAIELHAGEVLFDVAPRPGRPLRVASGALEIEVVGTRFVVHHDDAGGWVSMLEGHVRTRVDGGPMQDLRNDQRLEWPAVSASEPAPTSDPAPAPARTTPPRASKPAAADEGLSELLAEIATLRRDGAYREAVERLRATDVRRFSARARQLVSYEIGTLLERQLGDAAEACRHWAEHRRRYPNGRYDAIVARSLERLRCTDEAQ